MERVEPAGVFSYTSLMWSWFGSYAIGKPNVGLCCPSMWRKTWCAKRVKRPAWGEEDAVWTDIWVSKSSTNEQPYTPSQWSDRPVSPRPSNETMPPQGTSSHAPAGHQRVWEDALPPPLPCPQMHLCFHCSVFIHTSPIRLELAKQPVSDITTATAIALVKGQGSCWWSWPVLGWLFQRKVFWLTVSKNVPQT